MDASFLMYGVDVALVIATVALLKSYLKWLTDWKTLVAVVVVTVVFYFWGGSDSAVANIVRIVIFAAGGDRWVKRMQERKAESGGNVAQTSLPGEGR